VSTLAVEAGGGEAARLPLPRMGIALLSVVGLLVSAYLTLYHFGAMGELQCAVGSCAKVQSSRYAYLLGQPVALWGVGAYAALAAVALAGLQPRFEGARWVAVSLAGMAAVGVAFSAYLTYLEAFVIRAWCQWCVVSAILIVLIFLLSIPGLRRAR
jgi:uncharacterized membrane protein